MLLPLFAGKSTLCFVNFFLKSLGLLRSSTASSRKDSGCLRDASTIGAEELPPPGPPAAALPPAPAAEEPNSDRHSSSLSSCLALPEETRVRFKSEKKPKKPEKQHRHLVPEQTSAKEFRTSTPSSPICNPHAQRKPVASQATTLYAKLRQCEGTAVK